MTEGIFYHLGVPGLHWLPWGWLAGRKSWIRKSRSLYLGSLGIAQGVRWLQPTILATRSTPRLSVPRGTYYLRPTQSQLNTILTATDTWYQQRLTFQAHPSYQHVLQPCKSFPVATSLPSSRCVLSLRSSSLKRTTQIQSYKHKTSLTKHFQPGIDRLEHRVKSHPVDEPLSRFFRKDP